jgi:hypothetical protein
MLLQKMFAVSLLVPARDCHHALLRALALGLLLRSCFECGPLIAGDRGPLPTHKELPRIVASLEPMVLWVFRGGAA